VQVVGEVQRPGEFQAFAGLTLYDLLLQAGGPTDMACGTVEVASAADARSGQPVQVKTYTLAEVTGGAHRDEPIKAGMLVSLPRRGDKANEPLRVELRGQVRRPGTYALLSEAESLASLLERAGGLTEESDPFGVSLTRRKEQMLSTATSEQIQTVMNTMDHLLPPVSKSRDETDSLRINVANGDGLAFGWPGGGNRGQYETVLLVSPRRLTDMPTGKRISFSLEDRGSYLNRLGKVRLVDGDIVEVPRRSEVVQVLGAVQSPGPVFYQDGRSATEYLHRAGGVARDADVKRAVVIKVSGAVQPLAQAGTIDRGDVLVVASKYQVVQPPRRKTLGSSLGDLLGIALVIRGLR
jgi:protein involved in polysaccharide export with SLBB domain